MKIMIKDKKIRKIRIFLFFILTLSLPLLAYVGPGAGFAFLSSFLVLFLTFLLAVFSFLTWPFRFLFRVIKGQKAYKNSLVNRIIIIGLDGMEPSLAEKFMSEGKLPHLRGAAPFRKCDSPSRGPVHGCQ